METTKRIYPATQLIVAMDAKVLKTYMWVIGWASRGSVKYYPKQFAKACKMEENEVERCIQSLVDCKLVDVSKVDQTWILTPNAEQNQKYYSIDLAKVLEGKGIQMADVATWNEEAEIVPTKSDMTKEQMRKMIQMLQIQLQEKEEVEKMVKTVSDDDELLSQLPF